MRIILFAGKGGVGKTSLASATGLRLSRLGHRTLVLSVDPAHSVSDAFDVSPDLIPTTRGQLVQLGDNLWIQEVDIQEEVRRHWGDVHSYLSELLAVSGLEELVAEEVAIIPGMEETSSLLYVNQYHQEKRFDVIVLDCAPTGESLRFISIPSILRWYMSRLFRVERQIAKVARPIMKHVSDIPVPRESYFANIQKLFSKVEGVDVLLQDPTVTTVRLVTNPEKIVFNETQRAFMYFHLYGMSVDAIYVNRILPRGLEAEFFRKWLQTQTRHVDEIERHFQPLPVFRVPLFDDEIVGVDGLGRLGDALYGSSDPGRIFFKTKPLTLRKSKGTYALTLYLPFVKSGDVELSRVGEELVIRIGSFNRHVPLPRSIPRRAKVSAKLEDGHLKVTFTE
ncbi:MAG: ArsA family ATPase [Candidatus Riflebacteria bacterium]|nr:ArsA family ATPase [Candidatus Riflebacteria bacterium]